MKFIIFVKTSNSQTFSDRAYHLWYRTLSPRTTLFQENSIHQKLFDQTIGKPELTQMRHEENGCEKLERPIL